MVRNISLSFFCLVLLEGCLSSIQIKEWWISDSDYSGNNLYIVPLKIKFSRPMGYRKFEIETVLRLQERYNTLNFEELSFEYNGKKWYLIKDLVKDLGNLQEVKTEFAVLSNRNVVKNVKNTYEMGLEMQQPFFFPWDWEGLQQAFNHRKIFGNMKVGDRMTIVMTQIYSFDDELLQQQTFSVEVVCTKRNIETPPFMLLP
jgi:hypothetical protein